MFYSYVLRDTCEQYHLLTQNTATEYAGVLLGYFSLHQAQLRWNILSGGHLLIPLPKHTSCPYSPEEGKTGLYNCLKRSMTKIVFSLLLAG